MPLISLLVALLFISSSGLCGDLYFPRPDPEKVVVCSPSGSIKDDIYVDPESFPISDTDPLRKHFDNLQCSGFSEGNWEKYLTYWRKDAIKVGTKTNKGLVIEVKLPIVKVQTQIYAKWFSVDDLSPEIKKPSKGLR